MELLLLLLLLSLEPHYERVLGVLMEGCIGRRSSLDLMNDEQQAIGEC